MQFLVDPPITMQFLVDPFQLGGGGGGGAKNRILGEYRSYLLLVTGGKQKSTPTPSNSSSVGFASSEWSLTIFN